MEHILSVSASFPGVQVFCAYSGVYRTLAIYLLVMVEQKDLLWINLSSSFFISWTSLYPSSSFPPHLFSKPFPSSTLPFQLHSSDS